MVGLRKYFKHNGDHQPNSEHCHVAVPTKRELWEEYVEWQKSTNQPPLHIKTFGKLWASLFPYCDIRSFVEVSGKCETCYQIQSRRMRAKTPAEMLALKQCHAMHRGGLFMAERAQ